MTKWEYCAIGPLGPDLSPVRSEQKDIKNLYITMDGVKRKSFPEPESFLRKHVSHLIAHLGEQGWEMVGCGTVRAAANLGTAFFGVQPGGVESHMLYFKRPIE